MVKLNQSGFSLTEAILAVGVLALSVAAAAGLMANSANDSANLMRSIEKLELERDLLRAISDPAVCSANFGGKSLPSDGSGKLAISSFSFSKSANPQQAMFKNISADKPVVVSGQAADLKVKGVALTNIKVAGDLAYTAEFVFEYDKDKNDHDLRPFVQPVVLMVDKATPNRISSCSAAGGFANKLTDDQAPDLCTAKGLLFDDVNKVCIQNPDTVGGGGGGTVDPTAPPPAGSCKVSYEGTSYIIANGKRKDLDQKSRSGQFIGNMSSCTLKARCFHGSVNLSEDCNNIGTEGNDPGHGGANS